MWPVTVITFLEGLRSRVLYGIFLFAIFVMALSLLFTNFFMQDIGKIAVDFNLSAISFAGLMIASSLSVNLIAKDLEKRTIYFVLSKPISRPQYIFGKYFGIILLTSFAYLILTLVSACTLLFLKGQYINHFSSFGWLAYLQGIYFDLIKIFLLNAVIIFFSTVTSSSFITLLFSISTYIAGQSISEVVQYLSLGKNSMVEVDESINHFISLIKYLVPNFSAFDFKVASSHNILVNISDFVLFSGYGLAYSFMLLFFASYIFSRKNLL